MVCTRRGIRIRGHGSREQLGGPYVSANFNTLDDAQLAGAHTLYLDGRAATWAPLHSAPDVDLFAA